MKLSGAEEIETAAGVERQVAEACGMDDDVVGIPERERGQIIGEYLLDLEVEAFLSLCGERKTQERIGFTLKSGKPLRN